MSGPDHYLAYLCLPFQQSSFSIDNNDITLKNVILKNVIIGIAHTTTPHLNSFHLVHKAYDCTQNGRHEVLLYLIAQCTNQKLLELLMPGWSSIEDMVTKVSGACQPVSKQSLFLKAQSQKHQATSLMTKFNRNASYSRR